jgi:hypothetical protein
MKTLLILTIMIGLSGCINDQSRLSKNTYVPSIIVALVVVLVTPAPARGLLDGINPLERVSRAKVQGRAPA